jgi:hypothetical protein
MQAMKILAQSGRIMLKLPSKEWARKWTFDHPEFAETKIRKVDEKRANACQRSKLKEWFEQVRKDVDLSRSVFA